MSDAIPPSTEALLAHADWVRALARRLVSDVHAAEDLAQEALTTALESPPRHAQHLRGWFASVLRNLQRQRLRRPAPRALEDPESAECAPSAEEVVERAEAQQVVVEEVLALSEPYRSTLLLRYYACASPTEVAERLGLPLATITSRLTRAHALLRARLERRRGGLLAVLAPLLPTSPPAPIPTGPILLMSATTKTLLALLAVSAVVAGWRLSTPAIEDPEALGAAVDVEVAMPAPEELPPLETEEPAERAALVPLETKAPDEATPPALAGIVRHPDGTPAANAFVLVGPLSDLEFLESGGEPDSGRVWARTDEEGGFELEVATAGATYLTAVAHGRAPSETEVVALDPDQPREDVVLQLRIGGRLRGEVLRKDGSLARNREVRLLQGPVEGERSHGGRLLKYLTTDDQGRFEVEHLRPGRWGLLSKPTEEEAAELGGTATEQMLQSTVELSDGGEVFVRLGAATASPVLVRGSLTFGSAPLSPCLLQWIGECDDPMGSQVIAEADADGHYEAELPWPGAWYVRALRVEVGVDEEFRVDIPAVAEHALDLQVPSGELRGRVLSEDGEPVQGATVAHLVLDGPAYGGDLSLGVDRVLSAADGTFRLRSLGPGTYLLGGSHRDGGVAEPLTLELGPDEVLESFELVLRGEQRLTGRVLDAEDLPAVGAPVWIQDAQGRVLEPVTPTRTDREGRFRTPPLPPGEYSLVSRVGRTVATSAWLRPHEEPGEVELRLVEGAVLRVELTAGEELLRGRICVRDTAGRLFTGLRSADDPWAWKRFPFDSRRKHIGPLPAGNYMIEAFVPGKEPRTRELAVASDETRDLRFEL